MSATQSDPDSSASRRPSSVAHGNPSADAALIRPRIVFETPAPEKRKPRIALYSHDTMGLGHMRRNLLIAKSLVASDIEPTILMLAGAREASFFDLPRGVDTLTLPALRKQSDGQYGSRNLGVSVDELTHLRSQILAVAIAAFAPDLLIVDNVPRGARNELDLALSTIQRSRRSGCNTRCVLGLRDVRDNPEVVQREWTFDGNEQAVRNFYDEVWIYGDPAVYDLMNECRYSPDVAAKARYSGYLDRCATPGQDAARNAETTDLGLPPGKFVLCMVGGGQDGAELARAFAATQLPEDQSAVLLTGPYMPADTRAYLHARSATNPRLRVLDFVNEPTDLLKQADRVITMGGYNSVCEALSFEIPALIVPRVKPRLEQWIRAERLQRLGLVDVLHPDCLNSSTLSGWLRQPRVRPRAREKINLNGLDCLSRMAGDLLLGGRQRPDTAFA